MKIERAKALLARCIEYIDQAAGEMEDSYRICTDCIGFTESEIDELTNSFDPTVDEGAENDEDGEITKERVVQILQDYVNTDAEAASPEYIRDMLTDTCGMTPNEIEELGFGWIFPDEEGEDNA